VDDEISLKAGMTDEVSAALERIENRLGDVEDRLAKVSIAGKAMGDGVDSGAGKAKRGIDGAGRAAETAAPKIKKVGDEAVKAGAKAEVAGKGFDDFGNKVQKAGKKGGDFGSIVKGMKFATIATGIYALAGAISAAGAAGVIGVAHLAPMLLNLLNLGPAALTAGLAMAALKLSATQLAKPVNQIKSEFSGLGKEIAGGGLRSGVQNLANNLEPLAKLSGMGLRLFGTDLGSAARQAGAFISSTRTLNQVSDIFSGLTGILIPGLRGILVLLPAVLALIKAIIPSTQGMANAFAATATRLSAWVQAESASGNITRWLVTAWGSLHTAGQAVWNIVVALFNVFKIAYDATTGLGTGVLNLTQRFRDWTTSAAGQQKITTYFQNALPVIHQLGSLLATAIGLLAHVAAGANIGPLLGDIQSQLLPAIAVLLNKLTQMGGMGPALISLFSNIARILGGVSFSGFSILLNSLASITKTLLWMQQNVPGVNIVISALLASFVGFKVVGPLLTGVGTAIKLIGKTSVAVAAVSSAMETLGLVGLFTLDALKVGIAGVGDAIDAAFISSPIGWIILAIIAVVVAIVILWNKCAWFRDAVKAVWHAIVAGAEATWHGLVVAWNAVVNALVTAAKAVGNFFVSLWRGIVGFITPIWNVLVVAWKVIWFLISTYVKIYFTVIKFIIQVAIFIIVGIITLILIAGKAAFEGIAALAEWLWNTVLHPVFNFIGMIAVATWNAISTAAQFCWNLIVAGAQWLWNTILLPIFTVMGIIARAVWSGISTAAQFCWNLIVAGATAVWNGFLHPIFSVIASVGSSIWHVITSAASVAWSGIKAVWSVVSGWFAGIWHGISAAASGAWNGIKAAASAVGGVVKGVWNGIVGAVKGVWNFIAHAWNAIPGFTVPAWIPGIGGHSFSLPKLPTLYTGGPTPGGPAIVGEHGPEMLVRGGRVTGVLGASGPTIADLPRGGYVVPNIATITHGMAKPIPAPVAAAVAASTTAAVPPARDRAGDRALLAALHELTAATARQRPPIVVPPGGNTREEVLGALRDRDREERAQGRYTYAAGKG
jgi:phage-related protein